MQGLLEPLIICTRDAALTLLGDMFLRAVEPKKKPADVSLQQPMTVGRPLKLKSQPTAPGAQA